MDVKWTPKGTSGASCSHVRAWSAQGQGTITLQEPTMPSSSEPMMATLTAWHIPKSSALTNNKREPAGYPKRLFVRRVFPVFIVTSPPLPESVTTQTQAPRNLGSTYTSPFIPGESRSEFGTLKAGGVRGYAELRRNPFRRTAQNAPTCS